MDIQEVKFQDLNKVKTLKDLETAAHSQGVSLGEPKRDGHHVDYPDAKMRKGGKPARADNNKVIGGSASHDKITKKTHAEKLRQAIINSGRVDKRDKAKEERKAEAAANKAAKAKNRDPFTRSKKFEDFVSECDLLLTEGEF